jgi:phosphate transport system protein
MVLQAVESFGSGDVSVAENVFVEDDTMDKLYEKVRKSVVALLKAGEEPASVAPEILSVAKYYERMGDHAQSVSDWSIFRATGSYRGRTMGE